MTTLLDHALTATLATVAVPLLIIGLTVSVIVVACQYDSPQEF